MKPYQKKYKPKEGKRNTLWTEEDRDLLRTLAAQGVSHWDIGRRLDRSPGSISQQLYLMRKQDEADRFVDAVMEDYHEVEVTPKPSMWRRIMNIIRSV